MHEGGEHIPASSWGKRLGWGALAAMLIVWAFVLGILVGQGSILPPEDLQYVQEFLGLGSEPQAQPDADPVTKETEMSFYQGIKDDAPPASTVKPKPKAKKPAAAKPKPAAEKAPAPEPPAQPVQPAQPAQSAQPAQIVDTQAKGWVIQVASLKAQDMALKMVRRLKGGGLPAYVLRSQVKNLGLRYRVRVGPYDTRQAAGQVAARIKSKFNHPALIMREE